jgi:hypothetical protein
MPQLEMPEEESEEKQEEFKMEEFAKMLSKQDSNEEIKVLLYSKLGTLNFDNENTSSKGDLERCSDTSLIIENI